MKAHKTMLATALLAATLPSLADPLVLNFEEPDLAASTFEDIGATDRYAASGIDFTPGVWLAGSVKVFGDGAVGNFWGPGGNTGNKGAIAPIRVDVDGLTTLFTITTTQHQYNGLFSLIYGGESSLTITAHLLGGGSLSSATGSGTALCDASGAVCNWSTLSLDLNGVAATSYDIVGINGKLWIDNISFADAAGNGGGGSIPEPSGVALSLAALAALGWSRKRQGGK